MLYRDYSFVICGGPEKGPLVLKLIYEDRELGRLLGKKDSLDVGKHSSLSNGDTSQQLVQLIVILDGKLKMTGDDPGLLVVTGGVTGQLQDLGSEVLQDSGHVDSSTVANLSGIVPLLHVAVDTRNRELNTRTG